MRRKLKGNEHPQLSWLQTIEAHIWWRLGYSTYEIHHAGGLGASEAAVYNSLSEYRDKLWKMAHGEADSEGLEEAAVYQSLQRIFHPADPALDDGRPAGPGEGQGLGSAPDQGRDALRRLPPADD